MRRAYSARDSSTSAITLSFVDVFSCSLGAGLFVFLLFVVMPQGLGSILVRAGATEQPSPEPARVEPPVVLHFEGLEGPISVKTDQRDLVLASAPHIVALPADEVRRGVEVGIRAEARFVAERLDATFFRDSPGLGSTYPNRLTTFDRVTLDTEDGEDGMETHVFNTTTLGYVTASHIVERDADSRGTLHFRSANRSIAVEGDRLWFKTEANERLCYLLLVEHDTGSVWPSIGAMTDIVYTRYSRFGLGNVVVGFTSQNPATDALEACEEQVIETQTGWRPMTATLASDSGDVVVVSMHTSETQLRVDMLKPRRAEPLRLREPLHVWDVTFDQWGPTPEARVAHHSSDRGTSISVAVAQCEILHPCDQVQVLTLRSTLASSEFVVAQHGHLHPNPVWLHAIVPQDLDTLMFIVIDVDYRAALYVSQVAQSTLVVYIDGEHRRYSLQVEHTEPGLNGHRSQTLPWLSFTSDSEWVVP